MKKRLKLRTWVKIILTILILFVSYLVYIGVGILGGIATIDKINEMLVYIGWFWLIVGQVLFLSSIWEK